MQITLKTIEKESFVTKIAIVQSKKWKFDIYFKFPLCVKDDLTNCADPFLYSLIFIMMKDGGDIYIDSSVSVSESAVRNITKFSRLWSIWKPKLYKPISIKGNIVSDKLNYSKKLITAFSGGLDAAYTAFKYKNKLDPIYNLDYDKSIMIFGADISLEDHTGFEMAFASAKRMTDDLGVQLIPIETNIRKHLPVWSYAFGSVIIGCLSFFSKNYGYGAASDSSILNYRTPWGMNPITDQLFSTPSFNFISDGWEHTRTERAAVIRNWSAGLGNLRVCWQNKDTSKNCGHCEKCIRTKLNFKAVGIDHLPTMPSDILISDFSKNDLVKSNEGIEFYREIYEYGRNNKTLDQEWLSALDVQIHKWEDAIRKDNISKMRINKFKKILLQLIKAHS